MNVYVSSMGRKLPWTMRLILILGIFVFSILILTVEGSAKTITVGDDGGDHNTIQGAVNDASDGDTVFIYDGEYIESVIVRKSIIIEENNSNNTIINFPREDISL
jgi:pectin methylesterase-like acyl-CoA thioesterase